jgi:CRP-like cAMP-binding protein
MSEKILTMGAGRTLFKQGDKGGDLYFVTKGIVELSVREEETGQDVVIATLKDKNVIGTMSFVAGDPRSTTAIVKSEIEYVIITQGQRDKLLADVPIWLKVVIKDLAATIRSSNESFASLKTEFDKLRKKLELKEKQKKELEEKLEKNNETGKSEGKGAETKLNNQQK